MQINYAGKVTKNEFLKALLLIYKKFRVYKWIMGISLAILVLLSIILIIQGSIELKNNLLYYLPGGLFPIIALTFPWWLPYLQLSVYDQPGNIYRNNVFGVITENEITINGSNQKSTFPWQAFTKYKIADDILLLFQGKNCMNIFTKSMFTSQTDWEAFISLIKTNVLNQQHRR